MRFVAHSPKARLRRPHSAAPSWNHLDPMIQTLTSPSDQTLHALLSPRVRAFRHSEPRGATGNTRTQRALEQAELVLVWIVSGSADDRFRFEKRGRGALSSRVYTPRADTRHFSLSIIRQKPALTCNESVSIPYRLWEVGFGATLCRVSDKRRTISTRTCGSYNSNWERTLRGSWFRRWQIGHRNLCCSTGGDEDQEPQRSRTPLLHSSQHRQLGSGELQIRSVGVSQLEDRSFKEQILLHWVAAL